MADTGRIISVRAYDLRIGDMFSGDASIVTDYTRIHDMSTLKGEIIIRVETTCHGIHKTAEFPATKILNLWQTYND